MAHADHDNRTTDELSGGAYPAAPDRRRRRRKQAALGVAGLAALGAGAFLVTDRLTAEPTASTGALPVAVSPSAAAVAPSDAAPSAAPSSRAATTAATRVAAKPAPTTARPSTAAERVAAARAAAAKYGVKVQRPLPPARPVAAAITVTDSGSLERDGRTMRVLSARGDLTGQRELGWVADEGKPVGAARCSQNFKLSADAKPQRKPNLLVCWRTSAGKSVVTVAVDLDGDPSERQSVAVLAKRWDALG